LVFPRIAVRSVMLKIMKFLRKDPIQKLIRLFIVMLITIATFGCTEVTPTDGSLKPIPETSTADGDTPESSKTEIPTSEISSHGNIITYETASSLAVAKTLEQQGATDFVWASDKELEAKGLAVSSEEQVVYLSVDPQSTAGQIPERHPVMLTSALFEPTIAWKNAENNIRVWDLTDENELLALPVGGEALTSLSLSSSGDLLALSTYENRVEIWDISGKKLVRNLNAPVWLSNLDFSPDESHLAGVEPPNFKVRIFNLSDGSEVKSITWTDHASPALYGTYFSPDWTKIAWVARGAVQIMYASDGNLGPLLNHEDFVSTVAWAPDSITFASSAAGMINGDFAPLVYLWNAMTGDLIETLILTEPVTSMSFSPDGKELAVLSIDGKIQVWTVQE